MLQLSSKSMSSNPCFPKFLKAYSKFYILREAWGCQMPQVKVVQHDHIIMLSELSGVICELRANTVCFYLQYRTMRLSTTDRTRFC